MTRRTARRARGHSSSFFQKLLWSALLLLAFALGALDFYLTRYTASRVTSDVELRLTSEARLLAWELAAVPASELNRAVIDAAERAQARVTVITRAGVVLADSEHDAETMENHKDRPEVRRALQGATGSAIRHSATLNRDLCYVALPFTYAGGSGFALRLAVPLVQVSRAVSAVRTRIVYASLAAAALALILAWFFSARLSRRIERIKIFAERLLTSTEPATLIPESTDELGALSRALNHMGQQLRESMQKLQIESSRRSAILASMVEGVLAVGHDMRVLFCNESFAQAIGADPRSMIHAPLRTVLRDSALLDVLEHVLSTGDAVTRRIQIAAAGDRAFAVHAAPLAGEAGRGAVAVLHEITELERLENVRRDFVANVSHELRTPLAAILGYTETLLDGAMNEPETSRTFLETIRAHTIRLNNISADLLTLSDLDSGVSRTAPSSFSLEQAIATAVRTAAPEAQLRNVTVICGDIEPVEMSSYRLRLEQVLVNLLGNAIKFNHSGGEVRIEAAKMPDGIVKITVADTGCGIPAEDLSRIFERFYRVDRARSRSVGGTGLGLAIVKHAAELMNGKIEVASELGKGSVFTLLLPAVVSEAAPSP
ncbi:MAG TPA: ATP-binding protein, partial [Bryobacteraceae bacterium]|nr:ATP-binding protein [Bryobacteraceae bacterium]